MTPARFKQCVDLFFPEVLMAQRTGDIIMHLKTPKITFSWVSTWFWSLIPSGGGSGCFSGAVLRSSEWKSWASRKERARFMVPAPGFGSWVGVWTLCGLMQIEILSRFSSESRFERNGTFVSFLLPSFFFFLLNLSPSTFQFFFSYDRSQFCDPILISFSFLLFFILYFFLRPCYGPGTVLVMGIQGKKTMEMQGEISKSAIIVGDLNTPLSSSRQRKKKPQELTALWDIKTCSIHYQMDDECTNKDIFLVLCAEDDREGLGRVSELCWQFCKDSE